MIKLPFSLVAETPPAEIKADLAVPCFRHDPKKVAEKIKKGKNPLIEKVNVAGRYVNIILNKLLLAKKILAEIKKAGDKFGFGKPKKEKIFIEYSSPNIAKPMHVGHLRNTVIGNALKNIYQAGGYKVISANYLGDWGAQFGQLLAAWQKHGKPPVTTKKLFDLYVRSNKKDVGNLFKQLESGDKKLVSLWKKFRQISIKDFKTLYKQLGVKFDLWNGESFYKNLARRAVEEALKKKVAEKSGNAIAVNLEKYGLRSYLLQKSDGSTLYPARDLAAAKWRLKKYEPQRILYVVGHEQELYLKQIFKTLELMDYPAEKLEHISYNLVTIEGKKASTRTGRIIFAEDIIKEALQKTTDKKIGIGALIYNFLSQRRDKPVSFDWKKMLNLQGDSAPYLQYAYVRALSILKKSKIANLTRSNLVRLNEREGKIVLTLARFPEIIDSARKLNEPHLIAHYLNELVQEFNRFYTQDPVINAKEPTKSFRLQLVKAVAQVVKNGLSLLGIKTPAKM